MAENVRLHGGRATAYTTVNMYTTILAKIRSRKTVLGNACSHRLEELCQLDAASSLATWLQPKFKYKNRSINVFNVLTRELSCESTCL